MNETAPTTGQSGLSNVKMAVLIGLIATLAIANGFFFFQLDGLKQEMSKTKDSILIEIAKDRQVSAVSTVASNQSLEALRTDLEAARRHAATVAGSVRKDAVKHANQLAENLQEEQRKQQAQVNTELSQVKEATGTANQKITDVSVDVGNVRTEVAATKSELDKTIAELRSVHGDLGVQSGLIATNAKELTALRTLGERNYFEFDLAKAKQPYRIGDVSLTLKKSDTKRNRYTVEVLADDKRVEKKDKTANEPVQFYVSGARLPYEIVVNEVKKNRIVGYLATPKLMQSRKG